MNQISFITRFVAYLPDDSDLGARELSHAAGLIDSLGLDTLRQDGYLFAVAASAPSSAAVQSTMLLDVFAGTAASARLAAVHFDGADSEAVHQKAEQSAQCYNLLQPTKTSLSVESDALGLKPIHIARTPGGNVLGTRIADLLYLFPALAEPADRVAMYELMGFWTPLAGRTLHQRIRRTLPGGCYRWTRPTGLSTRRGRDIRPAPVAPNRLLDEAIEAIRDTSAQSLLDKTAGAARPVIMALSGGFDSRLIAALCRDQGIEIRALNYGRRQNEEWHSARAVARTLNLKLEMIPYRGDNTLRHLAHHLETMEGTADLASSSIMNLFEASSTLGSPLLHGYCGDAQAGLRVGDYSAAQYASHESLVDSILQRYYASTRPNLHDLFVPAIDLDEVHQDILSGLRTDCSPQQAYVLWYLENRNRRHVGSYFSLLGGHFDTIMPFYDRRLFDIWLSIPPIALVDRGVFRSLLAHYYPALARIPHPEEPAPIIPNLQWQLGRFCRGLPQHMLTRAVGVRRARDVFLRFHRHSHIWNLANLAAPQHRAHMLSRVAALRPILKDALGMELSPHYETTLSVDLQALRSVFLAAEYAQRRAAAT